jgi:hypothetical protein
VRRQARPATLDRATVAAFVAELLNDGKEAATARARQLALRRFAAWLTEEGELDADPLAGLKPPKLDSKVVPVLSAQQLRALLAACQGPALRDRRDEALVRLLTETGLSVWPSHTPCSASTTRPALGAMGLPNRRLRPLGPRPLGPGVAHRGRAPGLDGHLRAAAALPEPAPAGRVPAQRAAGELTLPVGRWWLLALREGLVLVLVLLVVDDPQDLDEAEGGSEVA